MGGNAPPELLTRERQFDTVFAEFAAPLVPYSCQAKIGGLPRKTVGEFEFCSDLQHRGVQINALTPRQPRHASPLPGAALTNAATRGHNQFASQHLLESPNGGIGRRASFRS